VSLSQAETLLRGSENIESLIEGDAVSHDQEGTEFGHEINELEEVDPKHHYARIEEDEPERARQLGHHRGRRFGKHSKYSKHYGPKSAKYNRYYAYKHAKKNYIYV